MSLEQLIADNTAALKQLIVVLSSATEAGALVSADAANAGAAPTTTRRRKKGEEAASTETATTTTTAAVSTNTTGAPIYVIVDANNTAAVIDVGQVIPSIPGMRQVSQAEYEAYKAQQAAAHTSAAAPAPAPVTMQSLTDRLVKIHGKAGNPGVMEVLSAFGAASVPALGDKDLNAVAAKIAEVEAKHGLAQPAGASLFG